MVLTKTPLFVTNLPATLVQEARANLGKPYPWGGDYAHAKAVSCTLGATDREVGIKHVNPQTPPVVNGLSDSCRRSDIQNGEGHYAYFRVDPLFVPYGTTHLKITVVARRISADKNAGMNLTYESLGHGYTNAGKWNTIPADEQWHELTWDLTDANFVGQWGWNFRTDATGSPNDFYIKEARVSK